MKRCEQARGAHAPHVGLETFEASACNWAAPYHEPKHIAAPQMLAVSQPCLTWTRQENTA